MYVRTWRIRYFLVFDPWHLVDALRIRDPLFFILSPFDSFGIYIFNNYAMHVVILFFTLSLIPDCHFKRNSIPLYLGKGQARRRIARLRLLCAYRVETKKKKKIRVEGIYVPRTTPFRKRYPPTIGIYCHLIKAKDNAWDRFVTLSSHRQLIVYSLGLTPPSPTGCDLRPVRIHLGYDCSSRGPW